MENLMLLETTRKSVGESVSASVKFNRKLTTINSAYMVPVGGWKLNGKGKKVPLIDDRKEPGARNVPSLNITWLEEMERKGNTNYSKLKPQLAEILSFAQQCFDSYYSIQGKPFADMSQVTLTILSANCSIGLTPCRCTDCATINPIIQ
jgi:hypothetical protein